MALKRAVITQAMGTGTAPFTASVQDSSAGFSSDIKVALFTGGYNGSLNATQTQAHVAYGAAVKNPSDTTVEASLGYFIANAIDGSSTVLAVNRNNAASFDLANSTYGWNTTAWNTDSITVTHQASEATNRYATTMLLGGDIEANVVLGAFSAETTKTISHGLSGAPEIILIFTNHPSSIPDSGLLMSAGFWATTGQVCTTFRSATSTANIPCASQILDSYVAATTDTSGTVQLKYSIGSVGASTFVISSFNNAGTATTSNVDLVCICVRGTSTPITAKAGIYTTPTATGTHSIGAGLGVQPSGLILLPTRMTAVNTGYSDDSAGQLGMFFGVDRSSTSATQYGGQVLTTDVGADPTYTRSHHRNDCALRLTQATGGDEAVATISAWQSDDVQLNYSDAPGSAFKIPYLMFGMAEATAPTVSSVTDLYGNNVATITGTNFGASRGSGQVYIAPTDSINDANKVAQTIVSWSDTSIVITVARGSLNYNTNLYLFVQEDGGTSNSSGYIVQIKSGITLTWTV